MRPKDAKTDGRRNPRSTPSGRLTAWLLQAASDGALFIYGTHRYPRIAASQGLEGLRRMDEEERRRKIMRRIRDLKRRGLLETKKRAGRLMFICTDRGEVARLRQTLKDASPRADGFRTLIVFDIPESQRRARGILRDLLRSIGCRRLQGSVWISDKEIFAGLTEWISRARLGGWVMIFSVKRD